MQHFPIVDSWMFLSNRNDINYTSRLHVGNAEFGKLLRKSGKNQYDCIFCQQAFEV